ncbi:tRNA (adenosine(37)-N6)-threonylcarbamoyltransferase complex dimerization subunit type 1 TsaB [Gracilimonas amylolytica]|uniref:tRNA (adenosine(37)-N6)-threonylcarbamoyltransferase complex dimerization subunit type 1 TsaB n=1 Tax=Gracilimonas amylolytica TaxID=1749045 RepID=UPI000CD93611|nr:tRNA (adenosine(37)-N6)-threonylcarbamoyltransferase complex dimerization subunit type 1 TsaB [Gracilimonas amylolytica]
MSFDKLLAIETATQVCSVCYQDERGEVFEKRTERKGSHSELLFIFIRELMEENGFRISDLNAVLVSTGPGSYTGLRIAASSVKGLLFGFDIPVYAGNTLAGFAQMSGMGKVHSVINARRKHLYHQLFDKNSEVKAVSEARILELDQIENMLNEGDSIIGTGMDRLDEERVEQLKVLEATSISAKGLIDLFKSGSKEEFFSKTTPEELESNYLSSSQVNNTNVSKANSN